MFNEPGRPGVQSELVFEDGTTLPQSRLKIEDLISSVIWESVPEHEAIEIFRLMRADAILKDLERNIPEQSQDVLAVQYGGNHYKGMKIQPVEYAKANDLDCLQFSVVKYITRHRLKAGAEDLKKCIHFAQMALKMDYGVDSKVEYLNEKKAGN